MSCFRGGLKYCVILTFAILTFISETAVAGPIVQFVFTGTVFVSGTPWTTNGINVGDPVTGSVSYDLSSVDSEASVDFGRYDQSIPQGVEVSVGSFTFSSSNYSVEIFDDDSFLRDLIVFEFLENVSDGGVTVLGFGSSPFLSLSSPTDLFDGDDLFSTIDLSDFPEAFGGLLADGLTSAQLQYSITSLTRVPEPTTLLLMGLGLAGIGYRKHCDKISA